jgi:3-hydroxyacyl-[acyl-carrier-protein] dehydratase
LSLKFDLVDKVLEQSADRIVTVKAVTSAEEYLGDHFPGFPVLPGVMMLESLVQAARRLADSPENLVVSDVRNVRYGNMVRPGESLRVEVTVRSHDESGWEFMGVGTVDGQVAVQGRFKLSKIPR